MNRDVSQPIIDLIGSVDVNSVPETFQEKHGKAMFID